MEVSPGLAPSRSWNSNSVLDRDFGLDSMSRAELILRLNRAFAVTLPDEVLSQANTVAARDIVVEQIDDNRQEMDAPAEAATHH